MAKGQANASTLFPILGEGPVSCHKAELIWHSSSRDQEPNLTPNHINGTQKRKVTSPTSEHPMSACWKCSHAVHVLYHLGQHSGLDRKSKANKVTTSKPSRILGWAILGLNQQDILSHTYHLSMNKSSKWVTKHNTNQGWIQKICKHIKRQSGTAWCFIICVGVLSCHVTSKRETQNMCSQGLELMSATGLREAMQYRSTALSNSSTRILLQSDTVQLQHSRNRGPEHCFSTENERQKETI